MQGFLISSTHANQHLLSRRLGKLKEIERTVDALENMKAYVSEEEYRRKMRSAFASRPVFETYDTTLLSPHQLILLVSSTRIIGYAITVKG